MRGLWRFLRLDTQTTDVMYDVVIWCHGASPDVVIARAPTPTEVTHHRPRHLSNARRAHDHHHPQVGVGVVVANDPRNEYCMALMTALYDRDGRFGWRRLDEAPDQTTRADANSTTRPDNRRADTRRDTRPHREGCGGARPPSAMTRTESLKPLGSAPSASSLLRSSRLPASAAFHSFSLCFIVR